MIVYPWITYPWIAYSKVLRLARLESL